MTKDKALKLALEALEEARTNDDSCEKWDRNKEAITAIKEALAQTEQKINHAETERIHPFKLAKGEKGVITYSGNGSAERRDIEAPTGFFFQVDKRLEEDDDIQDYKKPWVNLTDGEIDECDWGQSQFVDLARAIEAKLKEKNT